MAIKFVIDSLLYTNQQNGEYVFRDESTIGYCFINEGNCPVSINNYLLQPNSVLKTFEVGYEDQTKWQMNFKPTTYAVETSCQANNARLIVLIYCKI
jgi:hypothetical protein